MGHVSVNIDIAGLPSDRIVFSVSPLTELGDALHALSEPGHHPGVHGWATATSAALEPDLADRLLEAEFLWRHTFSDIFLPYAGVRGHDGRPGATLAEDLDLLDRIDDERFVTSALEFTCAGLVEPGNPSPLTNAAMRARALDMAAARGPRQVKFTQRLLADPVRVRGWIRRLFEDCDQAFFADTWRRVSVQLVADARHKTEVLRRKGVQEAMGAVSAALTLDEEAGRLSVDKLAEARTTAVDPDVGTGLTLLPSSFGWPHPGTPGRQVLEVTAQVGRQGPVQAEADVLRVADHAAREPPPDLVRGLRLAAPVRTVDPQQRAHARPPQPAPPPARTSPVS